MPAPVIPEHEPPDPDDYQEPRERLPDVQGAMDLLLWSRKHGFTMQSIKVGRVELVDVADMYPRRPLPGAGSSVANDDLDGDPNTAAMRAWADGVRDR